MRLLELGQEREEGPHVGLCQVSRAYTAHGAWQVPRALPWVGGETCCQALRSSQQGQALSRPLHVCSALKSTLFVSHQGQEGPDTILLPFLRDGS